MVELENKTMSHSALSANLCFRRVSETGEFSKEILFLPVLLFNLCVQERRIFVSCDTECGHVSLSRLRCLGRPNEQEYIEKSKTDPFSFKIG